MEDSEEGLPFKVVDSFIHPAGYVANQFPLPPHHTVRLHFPDFLALRGGHVTNLWPMECGWKGWKALLDLAQKTFHESLLSFSFPVY